MGLTTCFKMSHIKVKLALGGPPKNLGNYWVFGPWHRRFGDGDPGIRKAAVKWLWAT